MQRHFSNQPDYYRQMKTKTQLDKKIRHICKEVVILGKLLKVKNQGLRKELDELRKRFRELLVMATRNE